MTVDITVPVLAESVPDATLLEWRKHPGESVREGELVIELETDKVVLEITAPASGVLAEIVHATGDTVVSGEVLARIDTEATTSIEMAATPPPESPAHPPTAMGAATISPASPPPPPGAASTARFEDRHGPAVRKLLAEHGLEAGLIAGSGKDGRITKADVLAYLDQLEGGQLEGRQIEGHKTASLRTPRLEAPPASRPVPPAGPSEGRPPTGVRGERRETLSRIRQRIAERLLEAQRGSAILTTFNEVDMQPVMDLRERHKAAFEKRFGARLGFMSFFARAAVQALGRFPAVNAYIEGDEIVYHDYCDIGVAVGSPRGLVVPVLRNVETLSFARIESEIAAFGEKARAGSLSLDDMTGGTFTISNGGVFGSLLSTPILNPPQSAILGMHKIEQRPVVVDGTIVARPMMYLALSYDHRIIDGREAVLFLVTIKEALEDPARMLLEV